MNFRKAVFLVFIAVGAIFASRMVFGYGATTTHPGLTDEIIDFYNLNFENKLTQEEKEWIIQGSIDEDTPPRWINHFYDPVYNQGWTGEETGWLPEELMRVFSFAFLSTQKPVSSKDWANNQELQSKYKEYKGNRTWERAIYEYAKGDKKEAIYSLGFILHLIEDLTVPDHTRNDTHAHDLEIITGDYGSPYEEYTKKFTRQNLLTSQDLAAKNLKPKEFSSLDEYFENLARYSNNYFFSKDTINDRKYTNPKIVKEMDGYAYGQDKNGNYFKLAKVNIKKIGEYEVIKDYSLSNKPAYYPILNAYFSRLSQEAVLNGSGLINLFFKEAELAKKNLQLAEPPKESAGIFSFFGTLSAGFDKFISLFEEEESQTALTPAAGSPASVQESLQQEVQEPAGEENNLLEITEPEAGAVSANNESRLAEINQQALKEEPRSSLAIPVSSNSSAGSGAGFGGGSSAGSDNSASQSGSNVLASAPEEAPSRTEDLIAPEPPVIVSPINLQTSTTSLVAFSGLAEASSTISQDFSQATTTVDSGGIWSLVLDLIQSTSTVNFYASDSAGNVSSSTSIELFIDSISPTISDFYIFQCLADNLLSDNDDCLLATTTVNLIWASDDQNLDYYELFYSANISTTTATSAALSLSDNTSYIFSLKTKDKTGNWSEILIARAEIVSLPVVINEVAWMGTQANPFDEWLELYNNTSKTIDLGGWVLRSEDNEPYIKLFGSISPKGYFLLERTDDATISDIPYDQFYTGSLWDGGEVLELLKPGAGATTTIDKTMFRKNNRFYPWPAGLKDGKKTMERINPQKRGDDEYNWGTNIYLIKNGKDAKGNIITGTPKARNSVNYLITQDSLTADRILAKESSPYFADNAWLKIPAGVTLTIEPGVVIKFYSSYAFAGIYSEGNIKAEGTEKDKIIFTSFFDDQYGGDLNGDATSTSPSIGNWRGIHILASSTESVFDNVVFRYGGGYFLGNPGYEKANLFVKNADIDIFNSSFASSTTYGLSLYNSDSRITAGDFKNNAVGLYSVSGKPAISKSVFSNNKQGLVLNGGSAEVKNNKFKSNADFAFEAVGNPIDISGNSGFDNGYNGILLKGDLTQANATSTLKPNSDFPYIFDGHVNVVASSTLVIEPGVIIKAKDGGWLNVLGGKVITQGVSPSDIIFTSIKDNSVGGYTLNSTSTVPKPGDWYAIKATAGAHLDFQGVSVKYGGKFRIIYPNTTVELENSTGDFNNVLFDSNNGYGLYLRNSTTTIKNSEFRNHLTGYGTAVFYLDSPINLQNVKFSNNLLGVSANLNSLVETAQVIWAEGNVATTSPANLFP